jgi:hypothetical protein
VNGLLRMLGHDELEDKEESRDALGNKSREVRGRFCGDAEAKRGARHSLPNWRVCYSETGREGFTSKRSA